MKKSYLLLSFIILSFLVFSKELKITLLGTADIHGRFVPWDYTLDVESTAGSLTQLNTIVKDIRKENPNTILLEAGDLIQGNSAELFQNMKPHPAMLLLNEMKFDAWTVGNHEFDFGMDVLNNIAKEFNGAVLGGNVYRDNGERYFAAYKIIEIEGIKIGVVGLTSPMVVEFKEGTDIFKGMEIRNPTEEAKKIIKELEGKVDAIVGLVHMGVENENNVPNTGIRDIAMSNPEFNAIFGAHMHALVKEEIINGVVVVEPHRYGTNLSRVDLVFEKNNNKINLKSVKGSAIPIKKADGSTVSSDKELEKLVAKFHETAREDANKVIGELVKLDFVPKNEINGIPSVQIQETPLTNFFSEVMLYYSNADVVAHQIDNDLAKLDKGAIRKKDIAYNYQYAGGEVTVYKVTGKDLKDYMEWAVGYFNTLKDGDATISFDLKRRSSKYSTNDIFGGVKYDVDLREEYGNRIKNLRRLDNSPIKNEDEIKLGLNAYRMKALIAKGGALEGRSFEQIYSTQDESAFGEEEGTIRSLSARYIREVKNGVVEGKLNRHWKITGLNVKKSVRKAVVELISKGVLEVPKSGNYTNIASINIKEKLTVEEMKELAKKANVENMKFEKYKNSGDFYKALNKVVKKNK